MKKHPFEVLSITSLLITLLLFGLVVACDCNCDKQVDATPEKALMVSREYLKVQAGYDESGTHMRTVNLKVFKWRYEGHQYLEFHHYNGADGQGWIHDPDCPCRSTATSPSSGLSDYQKIFGSF